MTSVGLSLFNYQDDARSNKHKIHKWLIFTIGNSYENAHFFSRVVTIFLSHFTIILKVMYLWLVYTRPVLVFNIWTLILRARSNKVIFTIEQAIKSQTWSIVRTLLGSVSSPLCVCVCVCVKLGNWHAVKHNCVTWGVFKGYIGQLHVSACTGILQVVLRELKVLLYTLRAHVVQRYLHLGLIA